MMVYCFPRPHHTWSSDRGFSSELSAQAVTVGRLQTPTTNQNLCVHSKNINMLDPQCAQVSNAAFETLPEPTECLLNCIWRSPPSHQKKKRGADGCWMCTPAREPLKNLSRRSVRQQRPATEKPSETHVATTTREV